MEREYTVTLSNGKTGTATVDDQGGVQLDNGSFTEVHSFVAIVNAARRNPPPTWVRQIPGLAERIEKIFAQEKERGEDPFLRFMNSDGKLTVTDLRVGTSLSAPVAELQRQFAERGTLPKAFNSAKARQLLGIAG